MTHKSVLQLCLEDLDLGSKESIFFECEADAGEVLFYRNSRDTMALNLSTG